MKILPSVFQRKLDQQRADFSTSSQHHLLDGKDLEIRECKVMKEIVSSEGGENEIAAIATDKIEFPKLKELSLEGLLSFTGICKAMNAIELTQLSSLTLSNMPELKRLCPASDSESNCDPIIQPLFNDKDKLATIEELTIRGMKNLMEIWPGELEAKLRVMTVGWCDKLSSILFPSNSIKGMQNLEVLKVEGCQSIGVAFDLEGLVWEDGISDMALPSLKKVELSNLPKLTHVWKDNSTGIQGFQNLRSLVVNKCHSLRNLFSYSLAKLLVKLQKIEVTKCRMMESIIGNEPNADDAVITNMIMFPQLSSLKLSDLSNLSSFCFEACTFEGSLLKTTEVIDCPKMKILPSVFQRKLDQQRADFSTSSQHHLLDGKDLEISECEVMEEIVSSEGGEHEITTDKIKFPKLKQLDLDYLPSFTGICKTMNAIELPQLSSLTLSNMPQLKRLWPASDSESNYDPIIQPLFNDKDKLATIEELTIRGMKNLMEIWPGELEAKLRVMTVGWCHKLSSILFPSNSIKGMQNLEVLKVEGCQSIGVAFDLEGLVWEDGISDMAFPSLKKVELGHLRKLTHVWKDNSPGIQGFQNLRSLVVNDCDNLRNLFSYSLTKLLVKLQEIEVIECGMMESIIGNEPNADDAVITNMIMFPQLRSLKLSDLPNLSSFCFEACTFEGSLLKTIEVINCPKMKILPSVFQRKLDQQKADFSTSSQHHLLDGKFIFSYWFPYDSGKLTITDINGSIEMWHNQLEVDRLYKVRFMLVQFCGKLSNVISSNLIQRLRHLQRLKVWWCDSLETIFDLQGEEGTSIIKLERLELKLMYLPKLMHIWKIVSQQTHCFIYLQSLEVERCDSLRYIFIISMVKVLECLNYLRIGNCEKVEKIVTREAEKEEVWSKINILNVELENLPSLVCIGIPESQIHISELRVDLCPKYRGFDVEGE